MSRNQYHGIARAIARAQETASESHFPFTAEMMKNAIIYEIANTMAGHEPRFHREMFYTACDTPQP